MLAFGQVAYNFSLPYEKTIQKDGLVYPVTVWRDAERGVSRMDTFGGRNILISRKVGCTFTFRAASYLPSFGNVVVSTPTLSM